MNTIKELVKNPSTLVIDVRSPWEFESAHIPGAKNIPLDEIAYKLEEFKGIHKPIELYCRSGARSGMAAGILKQNGISDVYNGGGLEDLQQLLN